MSNSAALLCFASFVCFHAAGSLIFFFILKKIVFRLDVSSAVMFPLPTPPPPFSRNAPLGVFASIVSTSLSIHHNLQRLWLKSALRWQGAEGAQLCVHFNQGRLRGSLTNIGLRLMSGLGFTFTSPIFRIAPKFCPNNSYRGLQKESCKRITHWAGRKGKKSLGFFWAPHP